MLTQTLTLITLLLTVAVVKAKNPGLRAVQEDNLLVEGQAQFRGVDWKDATQLMTFMQEEGLKQPWVPSSRAFKKDPLKKYDEATLEANSKVVDATSFVLFDMLDRAFGVGYIVGPNDEFSTAEEFVIWYQSQGSDFQTRYSIPGVPEVDFPSFILSSPGLRIGKFREETIGGVTWTESNRVQFLGAYPSCNPTGGQFTFAALLRNLKVFYPAGSTVNELVDSEGNSYFQITRRGPSPDPLFGFTVQERVLDRDYAVRCLRLEGVPKNKDATKNRPLVCKQLQVNDPYQNAYVLVEKNDDIFPEPELFLTLYDGAPDQCTQYSFTDAFL